MKNRKIFLTIVALIATTLIGIAQTTTLENPITNKLSWWQDAKFGMFIHWGLYSQTAGYWDGHQAKGAEHFMIHEKISLVEYGKIAEQFNPTEFNAEEWVLLAKNAGMKYIVITTKHHEGFAMYDSKSSDYNIVKKTPYAKDPMKELAVACQKHNMKLGFYYSLGRDWEDPDTPTNWPFKGGRSNLVDFPDEDSKVFNRYFERKVKPQLKELLTEYGPIAILWFDTPEGISKEESAELRKIIEELQPDCIINNRIGNKLGDYDTPEQKIVTEINTEPWESCITMSKNWGYVEYDTLYKSPELLVRILVEIVSKGGNLLLNVGPTGKGKITEDAQVRLASIGKWVEINAQGIRGTKPWEIASENLSEDESGTKETIVSEEEKKMEDAVKDHTPKDIIPEVRFVTKGDTLYAFICSYDKKNVTIKALGLEGYGKIRTVTPLGVDTIVKWKQKKDGLIIKLPDYPISEIPVIGFEITPKNSLLAQDLESHPIKNFIKNPLIEEPGMSDPHMLVINDTCYVFTGHDVGFGVSDWVMPDWRIFRSADLRSWEHVGTIRPEDNYMGKGNTNCWAGDIATRNGKYYWYFSNRKESTGVMVASKPEGPYIDALGKPLVDSFDPTIFVDDDNTPYIIYGEGIYKIARLKDSMIELDEEPKEITINRTSYFPETDKNSLHKYNGVYYLGCAGFYATSKNIYGPYETIGVVGKGYGLDIGYGHGDFFAWKGDWYHTWCRYRNRSIDRIRDCFIAPTYYKENGIMYDDTKHINNKYKTSGSGVD